jgi:hypothetical protein
MCTVVRMEKRAEQSSAIDGAWSEGAGRARRGCRSGGDRWSCGPFTGGRDACGLITGASRDQVGSRHLSTRNEGMEVAGHGTRFFQRESAAERWHDGPASLQNDSRSIGIGPRCLPRQVREIGDVGNIPNASSPAPGSASSTIPRRCRRPRCRQAPEHGIDRVGGKTNVAMFSRIDSQRPLCGSRQSPPEAKRYTRLRTTLFLRDRSTSGDRLHP